MHNVLVTKIEQKLQCLCSQTGHWLLEEAVVSPMKYKRLVEYTDSLYTDQKG